MSEELFPQPSEVDSDTLNAQEGSNLEGVLEEPKAATVSGDADGKRENIIPGTGQSERSDPIPDATQESADDLSEKDNDDKTDQEVSEKLPTKEEVEAKVAEVREKVRAAAGRVLDIVKASNPELVVTHAQLIELVDLTDEYYSGKQEVVDYLRQEVDELSHDLQKVSGVVATFGLGYPFYAIKSDGSPVATTEIPRYLGTIKKSIQDDFSRRPEGWVCPTCQDENKLEDLKTTCKPCDLVDIKPRMVFEALPDADLLMVVDEINPEVEQQAKDVILSGGYASSEQNMTQALNQAGSVLRSVNKGEKPTEKLPVDLHMVSKADISAAMDAIAKGEINVVLPVRSLYGNWVDHPILFGPDFTFSLTGIEYSDPQFEGQVTEARKQFRENIGGAENAVKKLEETKPRMARILEAQPVRDILKDRIDSWQ